MRAGLFAQAERARLRVGGPARAPADARPAGSGSLRCSAPEGGSGPRPRTAGALLRNVPVLGARHPRRRAALGRRRDAPRGAALLGAYHSRPDLPTRSLASTTVAYRRRASVAPAKPWVGVRWRDLCGAEERRTRGRARSALRALTRRDCSSAANAVSAASFATGYECEHRRGVGAQRRPSHHERRRIPSRGFARPSVCR
jgi:hypothetical protein